MLLDFLVESPAQGLDEAMLRFVHQGEFFLGLLAKLRHARVIFLVGGPKIGVLFANILERLPVLLEALLQLLQPPILG